MKAAHHGPTATDLGDRFAAPSAAHPLGTDGLGREMLARLFSGGVMTLGAATFALIATTTIGTPPGTLAAWVAWARVGSALLIVTDSLVAIPEVVLALVAVSILGANLVSLLVAVIALLGCRSRGSRSRSSAACSAPTTRWPHR